jgi:hypothetical protein
MCDGRKELSAGVSREYSSYCGNYTSGSRKRDGSEGTALMLFVSQRRRL